jgi:hypothetical protein
MHINQSRKPRIKRKHEEFQKSQPDVIRIPRDRPSPVLKLEPKQPKQKTIKIGTKIIEIIDIKDQRQAILAGGWRTMKPQQIVQIWRSHYTNLKSASVMLSLLKKALKELEDGPDDVYLSKLALTKQEYNQLRKEALDSRKRGALNVLTVSCADALLLQAFQYIIGNDPRTLLPAAILLSGARPIGFIKTNQFTTQLYQRQPHAEFWARQTKFAKKGAHKKTYNASRDRVFLCPYYLYERAQIICRKHWPTKHLSRAAVSNKYSSQFDKLIKKAFPQLPGINARLCRRIFAAIAFHYFGKSFYLGMQQTQASMPAFASWHLGHSDLDSQVIAYQSIHLRPHPTLDIFKLGRELKIKQTPTRAQITQAAPIRVKRE